MMNDSLNLLLEKLSQDLPLPKIAPPFLLAYTISFINSQEATEEQKPVVESILARYDKLRLEEVREALSFEGAVEKRDAYRIYNLYMNDTGYLIPRCDDPFAALSSPRLDEGEELFSEQLLGGLASAVFSVRVDSATELFGQVMDNAI